MKEPLTSMNMNNQDLRIIEYALCFLAANWSEDEEDSLKGVSYKKIEILAQKFMDIRKKQKELGQ